MSDFQTIAKVSDVPEEGVRVVEVNAQRIALCNVAGQIFAVEDRCSHDDGPLGEGLLEGREIECPRHGARFDVSTGAVTCMPAVAPIKTYPVRLSGEDIQVSVEE